MNIFSFSKTRAYRSDGKIIAILSATLPRCEEDAEDYRHFNSFYSDIFDRYSGACEKIEKHESRGITKISVDFKLLSLGDIKLSRREVKRKEHIVIIKRTLSFISRDKRRKIEALDVFDTEAKVFIR